MRQWVAAEHYSLLLFIAIGMALLALRALFPILSDDLWTYLKVVDVTLQTHKMPTTILFAVNEVAHRPYIAHSWLANVLLHYLLPDTFSAWAMSWVRFVFFLCFGAIVYAFSRLAFKEVSLLWVVAIYTVLGVSLRFFLRPELFGFLMCLLQLGCLRQLSVNGPNKWLILAVLFAQVLWANMHGSFMLGWVLPPMMALYTFEQDKKINHAMYWAGLSLATVLVSLINPYGITLWQHCWWLAHADYIRSMITEWHGLFSPHISGLSWNIPQVHFFIFCLLMLWFVRKAMTPVLWLWSLFALWLPIDANRQIGFCTILLLQPVWHAFSRYEPTWQKERCYHLLIASFIATLICWHSNHTLGHLLDFYHDDAHRRFYFFSDDAIDVIAKNIQGPIYNSQIIGGQLLYNFYPTIKVGLDGRVDAYGKDYHSEYIRVLYQDTSYIKRFLAHYHMHAMILTEKDFKGWQQRPSYRSLVVQGPWRIVYKDDRIAVLVDGVK